VVKFIFNILFLIRAFTFVALLICPALAQAERVADQVWANFILARPVSEKLYLEYDIEAAKLVSGGDPWRNIYGTALAEYYPNGFVDLTGELVTGFTEQTRAESSFEATVRLGIRLHLLMQLFDSELLDGIRPERLSSQRFNIANLARIEHRNFWYDIRPKASDSRFRNRLEFKWAVNRKTLSADGLWYLVADAEWFVPLDDEDVEERFATKRRFRIGFGYRHSYRWRVGVLLMRDSVRDTLEGQPERDAQMINFRVHRFF
jgi:hypothetical protein